MDDRPEASRDASSDAAAAAPPPPPPSHSSPPSNPKTLRSPPPAVSPLPSSAARLWRPAAQRNLRNQWSKLASCRQQWASASSAGRSHATSLVNAHLSHRYVPSMELGVLKDMPNIRNKACLKLFKQQELHKDKLLSAYKDMVTAVTYMVSASRSMRCFLKGSNNSQLVQFSVGSEDTNDTGDGGGIPVVTFWSISSFENLAQELVEMFELELSLKEFLIVGCEVLQPDQSSWSQELYPGEFEDLSQCHLLTSKCELLPPRLKGCMSDIPPEQGCSQLSRETLQVYLTTWLAEVNIDTHRVGEIFAIVGEEMHVNFQ
ncbi:uncharacterized protein LOC115754591 isoform X2 [Rhodamnia argentea]|uniref:Uncharacterized protein LOC115754591 isoform X2 n=1 Tax=Rhodamnia argentea TaxID=178133 RepID=A0ABM3H2P8_9MYRT|nr:uncharacterized protein LOC115754591 isoform X2 [Rhodamnia argentea]